MMRKIRKMRKKLLALTLICATILLTLPGCGGKFSNTSKNTLTLLIQKGDLERNYIQEIIGLYEAKTGNKIKPVAYDSAEFDKKSKEIFAGSDLPDLLFHFNDTSLSYFNVPEHFYYMNNEPWVSELTDSVKANCLDSDGNVLGLPFWENSLSGCYYNKTLLDQLGLKPAATQAEFDALCQALKTVGYTPLYWSSKSCNWIFQFGLDPIFADNPDLLERLNRNEITYADIPAVTDMVTWLDNAYKMGWFNANYQEALWDDISPAMQNGESVLFFVWDTWFSTEFKEGGKFSGKDFAVMPVFMNTVNMGTYEGGNMNMLMANKNSPRLQLALDFLRFCATPENYNFAFDGVPTVKCFKNQTTNIQSDMVTDAIVSIEANQRVSTAWPKIIGYQQNDMGAAVLKLFKGEVDVAGCVRLMDEYRIKAARDLGAAGF